MYIYTNVCAYIHIYNVYTYIISGNREETCRLMGRVDPQEAFPLIYRLCILVATYRAHQWRDSTVSRFFYYLLVTIFYDIPLWGRVKVNSIYKVFTGNCGKVMGNLLYYLYCLMLDIWRTNIRNKKLTVKSFLEGFQCILKCPSVRFDASLGSW